MKLLSAFEKRIENLETSTGLVKLPDGTFFKPGSGLDLLRKITLIQRDEGREPLLSDFSEEDQERLRGFAKWVSDPRQCGAISVFVIEKACEICGEAP